MTTMPSRGNDRSKRWCFTLNNYTDDDVATVYAKLDDRGRVRYSVVGVELGAGGTPHLQGFLLLAERTRLLGVKQLLGVERVHLEPAYGTDAQAADYCKKEGNFREFGTFPAPSKGKALGASNLDAVKKMLDSGASAGAVADAHFGLWCQYRRAFDSYLLLRRGTRSWATQVVWCYGGSGYGKSYFGHRLLQDLCGTDWCSVPSDLVWFDGYGGHRGVMVDELAATTSINVLLRLIDRYPYQVPIKGGFVPFLGRILVITSQFHPRMYFADDNQYPALQRRLQQNGQLLRFHAPRQYEEVEIDFDLETQYVN